VTTADCALETEPAVAVKLIDLDPLGTVIDDGTLSALLLLDRPTMAPPEGADDDSTTVQVDELPAVRLVGEHESDVMEVTGATVMVAVCELPL